MATLAAHDQENAVRNLTIGPGGKPIHAGAKAFGSKTPGNKAPKTPFKVPLNDENVTKQAGKANGKGGKLDSNAFVTPAGPRNRAPLGMKTTNAKAQGFQTPAPLTAKTQKISPRLHRPKVKIHQPEPESDSEDDVPEVEYMPPKMVPLKDDMDDYLPRDWNFPKFTHNEMVAGMWNAYHNPITDDGRPKLLREFEEGLEKDQKKAREDFAKLMDEEAAKDEAEMKRYFGVEDPKKNAPSKKAVAVQRKTIPAVSTLRARSAAAALSSSATPSYAAPTAATKSRVPTGVVSSKKTIKPLADQPGSRQAAAVAASKSTIGYAQGRAGRAAPAARKPLSNVTKPAPFSTTARRPASSAATTRAAPSTTRGRSGFTRSISTASDATLVDSPEEEPYRTADEVERDFEIMLQTQDDDDDDEAWANSFNSQLQGDFLEDDLAEFQFKIPEGL